MHVTKVANLDELLTCQDQWDNLAGNCVFRRWAWQSTWWRHYGDNLQLFVLLVSADETEQANSGLSESCNTPSVDPSKLIAIMPCYLESSFTRGQVLRLLGDGEICSDHLDILAAPDDLETAAKALADYLVEQCDEWDATDFTAIGSDCTGLLKLSDELESLGCQATRTPNESRWAVPLPESWDEFLALQSKSHRKQIRRLEKRVLDSEQATWHLVQTPEEFEVAWPILVDLHQRRRISLGEPGCFASKQWADFHRDIARKLLNTGELRLSWLEISGQPVAAEYHFGGDHDTWAYQGGVDPDRIDEEPGRLSMIRTLQHAIAEGHKQFDLMRGDEPYKAHWRAQPTETFDIQIVPARNTALWRNQAFGCLQGAVKWTRQLTNMLS